MFAAHTEMLSIGHRDFEQGRIQPRRTRLLSPALALIVRSENDAGVTNDPSARSIRREGDAIEVIKFGALLEHLAGPGPTTIIRGHYDTLVASYDRSARRQNCYPEIALP